MIYELNALSETPLNDPFVEFVPLADQSPEVANWPPQVINEDSHAVNTNDGGGVDEDNKVVQIDNIASVLSSKDHPSNHPN